MPNKTNIKAVEDLSGKFERAQAVYFTDYLGLDVASITDLRSRFYKEAIEFRVVKNTLTKIAADHNQVPDLSSVLVGPTALAIAYDDPTKPARILLEFTGKHGKPTVKGILFAGKLMGGSEVQRLASLPTREQSLAMLMGALQQPLSKVILTLKAPLSGLINVLNSLKDQKS